MLKSFHFIVVLSIISIACTDNPTVTNPSGSGNGGSGSGPSSGWLIPQDEVFDGGPGKDGIPALENPESLLISNISYLSDDDLVIGFEHNNEYKAYPHAILDWHEIINDELNGKKVAITYCPLTGTGIAWNRLIDGKETTYGVSGLLYNTNLIPYDRLSNSNWCQISLECVNGSFIGKMAESFHVVETNWKTWKEMFPNSKAVSSNTGFSRSYGRYPYGDYKTNNSQLLFPVSRFDKRLPEKDRVLAVIQDGNANVYQFSLFEGGTNIILDHLDEKEIIIIGDKNRNFIIAFENNLNGTKHSFTVNTNSTNGSIFQDETGNQYDLFGNVFEGPDKGSALGHPTSFMAYWFSVGAFYSKVNIYGSN